MFDQTRPCSDKDQFWLKKSDFQPPDLKASNRELIHGEQHKKYLYNQSSHNGKIQMFNRWSVASFINLKVGMPLYHGVLLRFFSLLAVRTCWVTFQPKNNVRSTPTSFALTLLLHWSHNMCTTIITYVPGEKGME